MNAHGCDRTLDNARGLNALEAAACTTTNPLRIRDPSRSAAGPTMNNAGILSAERVLFLNIDDLWLE
jgi:hypothetical protein